MAILLLIRHGETQWNREDRFQGSADIPLSEGGRAQARQLANQLADKHLAAIYSSPLSRALDTAQALAAEHGLDVHIVDDLQEINVGEWSGKTWAEIQEVWPELMHNWRANPLESGPPPGGEDYAAFRRRCMEALDYIAGRHGDTDQVAVVCHGGVIRAVITGLLGIPWQTRGKIYTLNCSITRMRWQPGGDVIIDVLNDACHLAEDTQHRWQAESKK